MAEYSIFWNTNGVGDGAAPITQQQTIDFFRRMFVGTPTTECIVPNFPVTTTTAKELRVSGVSGTAPSITVQPGAAVAYGFAYENTGVVTKTLTKPVVNTTGGYVVLEARWSTMTVRVATIQNTDGVAALPALTRTPGTLYQVPLASYTVTTGGTVTVTDVRGFLHFNTRVENRMIDEKSITYNKLEYEAVNRYGDDMLGPLQVPLLAASGRNTTALGGVIEWHGAGPYLNWNIEVIGDHMEVIARAEDVGGTRFSLLGFHERGLRNYRQGGHYAPISTRQGGSPTSWATNGTSTQTVQPAIEQLGYINLPATLTPTSGFVQINVTFPKSFLYSPHVMLTANGPSNNAPMHGWVSTVTPTAFVITVQPPASGLISGGAGVDNGFFWRAVGEA